MLSKSTLQKVIIKKASGETELFNVTNLLILYEELAPTMKSKTVINDITEWIYSVTTNDL